MKKIINLFITIFVLFMSISLTACSNNTIEDMTEESVVDMIGREVKVKKGSYKSVVCVGAGALRLYTYVCDVDLLSGVEDIDNYTLSNRPKIFDSVARPYFIAYKEVFKNLPSCGVGGPMAQTAEAEKILSCNPDIVISEFEDVDKENALQAQLGVPVITLKCGNQGVFDENLKNSITLLGDIFNRNNEAKALNDFIASEKALIEQRVKDVVLDNASKVYICGLGNWGTTNHLMTVQNYAPFTVAKINNIINDLAKNGVQAIEAEKYESLAMDMDKIIIDAAAIKNIKDPTVFDITKAKQNNEVYLQMAYNAYYTNVEIALANTWYNAMVVYPDLFSDINIKDKLNEITNAFLGKNLADEIYACPSSFGGYQKINFETFFQ